MPASVSRHPETITIEVPMLPAWGGAPYSIVVAHDGLARLGTLVRKVAPAPAPHARAMLIMDANVAGTHGRAAEQSLRAAGYAVTSASIVAEESRKTLETTHDLYSAMLAAGLERDSPVIALGGGIVGDVAGFAAATFLRGVPVVQVPTTLLAMVDAAIGGKTGVNLALPGGGLGKNLVGAFWQPRAVLADPATLATLPARDFRCGLAECVKHALIADADLFRFIDAQAPAILSLQPAVLIELIARCARIKATIVAADEREAGDRALLNLGHTFAHAIESIEELGMKHGEAVAIGLVASARCAAAMGRAAPELPAMIEMLLAKLALPVPLPRAASIDDLMRAMRYDKKVSGGALRLILPRAIGHAEIAGDVPERVIRDAWTQAGASE